MFDEKIFIQNIKILIKKLEANTKFAPFIYPCSKKFDCEQFFHPLLFFHSPFIMGGKFKNN